MTYYKGEDFDTLVSKGNFLIDFYADWCGPCKMLGSVLETISDIEIIKVNVDEQAALALEYRIASIPTLVFMKYGIFQERMIGLQQKKTIVEQLHSMIDQ